MSDRYRSPARRPRDGPPASTLGKYALWSGFAACLLTALLIQGLGLVAPLERALIDAQLRLLVERLERPVKVSRN